MAGGQLLLQVPEGLEPVTIAYHRPGRPGNGPGQTCQPPGAPSGSLTLEKSGWQKITAGPEPLFFLLSHVLVDGKRIPVRPDAAVYQGRGVRLPGNLGRSRIDLPDRYVRRQSLEDQILADLNYPAYRADFFARLEADGWQSPEFRHLRQFHTLRLAKYALGWADFQETRQFAYLRQFLTHYRGPVLLINNPESPLTLSVYRKTVWYAGYLNFLKNLSNERVRFVNLADFELPARSFIDAHHLSYQGMELMQEEYARLIQAGN